MTTVQKIIILICTAMLALSSAFLIGMEEKKGIKRKSEQSCVTTRARTAALRELHKRMTAAITTNQPAVLAQLITEHPDFDIDAKNRIDGDTLLMYAAQYGFVECAHILLDHGADINAQNNTHDTALHLAVVWDHQNVISLLVQAGADVNIVNNFDATPLLYACDKGNAQGAQLLVDHGASLDNQDGEGNTAFHAAVQNDDLATAKILFAAGADMSIANEDNNTVIEIAIHNARKYHKKRCIQFFGPFKPRKLV